MKTIDLYHHLFTNLLQLQNATKSSIIPLLSFAQFSFRVKGCVKVCDISCSNKWIQWDWWVVKMIGTYKLFVSMSVTMFFLQIFKVSTKGVNKSVVVAPTTHFVSTKKYSWELLKNKPKVVLAGFVWFFGLFMGMRLFLVTTWKIKGSRKDHMPCFPPSPILTVLALKIGVMTKSGQRENGWLGKKTSDEMWCMMCAYKNMFPWIFGSCIMRLISTCHKESVSWSMRWAGRPWMLEHSINNLNITDILFLCS